MTSDRDFHDSLRLAQNSLTIARFSTAVRSGVDRAAIVTAAAAVVFGPLIVLARVHQASFVSPQIVCGASLVVAALVTASSVLPVLRAVPLTSVAERLDLATDGHNRISSAYEFSRRIASTDFEKAAIADGLKRLREVRFATPVWARHRSHLGRSLACLLVAFIVLTASLLMPVSIVSASGRLNQANFASAALVAAVEPVTFWQSLTKLTVREQRHVGSGVDARQGGQNSQSERRNSALTRGAGSGDAGTSRSGFDRAMTNADAREGLRGEGGEDFEATLNVANAHSSASPGLQPISSTVSEAAAGATGATPPPAGGEKSDKQEPSPTQTGDGPPEAGSGGSGKGDTPPPTPPTDAVGGGEGEGPPMDDASSGGSGTSPSASESPPAEASNGRSTGNSPPKKSRGVPPSLLGANQPDVFQGRLSAGPDERTKLDIEPQRDPGESMPAADPLSRAGDERPVTAFRVPATLRGLVGQYFEQFHNDALLPATR